LGVYGFFYYRDKKVVGVFVRVFRAPTYKMMKKMYGRIGYLKPEMFYHK
jgi:hypothetical protein